MLPHIHNRPLSQPAMAYDPYHYYDSDLKLTPIAGPSKLRPLSTGSSCQRLRAPSVCSTLSVFSNDTDLDLEDRRHDFDEEDNAESDLSPLSPAESTSSRASWSTYTSHSTTSSTMSRSYAFSDSKHVRKHRPLPALPTTGASPLTRPVTLPPTKKIYTPPLRLRTSCKSMPPPSYEEAISARPIDATDPQTRSLPPDFDFDRLRRENPERFLLFPHEELFANDDGAFLTSPADDEIDWEGVEVYCAQA